MNDALRKMLLNILILFRGIVRLICKGITILIVIMFIANHLLEMNTDWSTKLTAIIFMVLALAVLWGYDKILHLLCPEDEYLNLPF